MGCVWSWYLYSTESTWTYSVSQHWVTWFSAGREGAELAVSSEAVPLTTGLTGP